MTSPRGISQSSKLYELAAFIILWHFFFASSFVLRLNPQIFWPVMFCIGAVSLIWKKQSVRKTEAVLFLSLLAGLPLCFFAADAWNSVIDALYFFIYLGVAAMMARHVSTERLLKFTLAFCIVHLLCIYLQVLLPDVYKAVILPLLPSYAHSDIILQMTYNASYYGFTVQTSMTAMYMTIGAITAAVLVRYAKRGRQRLINIGLIALFITGVLFTTRRGSILALFLILMVVYFDTSRSKLSRILLLIAGIAFLLSFGIDRIPGMQGLLDKFSRLSGNLLNGRQEIWRNALDNFWKHPLFGYGVGQAIEAGGGSLVDNAYLTVLVERGIIGTVIWFAPILWIFIRTLKRKRSGSSLALDFSFYVQLLFFIMSMMENYFGQAMSMFFYDLAVLSAVFSDGRPVSNERFEPAGKTPCKSGKESSWHQEAQADN